MPTTFEVTTDSRNEYRPAFRRTDEGCSIPAGTVFHLFRVQVDIPAAAAANGAAKTLTLHVLAPDEEHAKAQASSWDRENPEPVSYTHLRGSYRPPPPGRRCGRS